MNLINNLENLNLSSGSSSELEDKFIHTFNQIFNFNNENIKVIGTINNPYFRAKDILKILGYSDNKKSMNSFIQDQIPEKYKKTYENIILEVGGVRPLQLDYHEKKEIYIKESGLFRLISRSNKPNVEPFQDYIHEDLLPSIRKKITKKYENIIKDQNDIIKDQDDKLNQIIDQNNQLINQNNQLIDSNKKLLQLAEKQDIKLDNINQELIETKEILNETNEVLDDTSNNLNNLNNIIHDELIPNRNLPLSDDNLNHYLILYKSDNQYLFIRGQLKYVNSLIKNIKKEDIIISLTKYPNPIDFINKLKEKSIELNYQVKLKIKDYINKKYPNISKSKFINYEKKLFNSKNKFFEIKLNKLILNRSKIEDILDVYNDLLKEKNTVEEEI